MGLVKYIYGTEAQILALTDESPFWIEQAFYYPDDKNYFYQLRGGVMKRYDGSDSDTTPGIGTGIKLNDSVIGGVKTLIELNDILDIPIDWDYNVFTLDIDGDVNNNGQINML